MVMFYHAEGCGCGCGHCHAAPPPVHTPKARTRSRRTALCTRIPPALAQVGLAAATARATRPARTRPTSRFVALAEGPPHGSGCGCESCRTIGAVLAACRGRCEGGRSTCQL